MAVLRTDLRGQSLREIPPCVRANRTPVVEHAEYLLFVSFAAKLLHRRNTGCRPENKALVSTL
jgi:hypothetical protein